MCFWPFTCCRKQHDSDSDDGKYSLLDNSIPQHSDYDSFGNLKYAAVHDREKELQEINLRKNFRAVNEEWFLIHSSWLLQWSRFVSHSDVQPGPISNDALLIPGTKDKIRNDLRALLDWRIINGAVWSFYVKEYGGGPTIFIKFSESISPEKIEDHLWLQSLRIPELVVIYDSIHNSDPYLIAEENMKLTGATWSDGKQKIQKAKEMEADIAAEQAKAVGALMASDLARQKEKQAEEISKKINQESAYLLGLELMDEVGKMRIEEAKKLEKEEENERNLLIASQFTGEVGSQMLKHGKELEAQAKSLEAEALSRVLAQDYAHKQMEEAKKLEEEEKIQESVATGELLVDELARIKLEQAHQLEELQKEELKKAFLEQLITLRGVGRVRAALTFGDIKRAEEEAAVVLQSICRGKLARNEYNRRKQEKERLRREAAAIKIQCIWRRKIAQKRAEMLRIEKERRRQEAAATIIQCAWRSKLARRRAEELRRERERIMREGAALKIQCAYRCRIARRRLQELKAERQRMLEEGSAIRIQCAYRRRLAQRKLAELKAERERLRREAAAIKLQTHWRCYLARKKLAELKAERQRLLEEGSAIRIQCAWRRYLAKQKLEQLRKEKRDVCATRISAFWRGKYQRQIFLSQKRAAIRIETSIRKYLAYVKVQKLARTKPRPFILHIISASNLRCADLISSDPYILISSHRQDEDGKESHQMLAKTQYISSNLNPVFDEFLLIGGASGDTKLYFTVCDYDIISDPDFLGQTAVDMDKMVPDIWDKNSVPLVIERELTNFLVDPVQGHVPLMISSRDIPPKGSIKVQFLPTPAIYSFCGALELYKKKLTGSEWVDCYGVLVFNRFQIFLSRYEQWKPLVDINPKEIHHIQDEIEPQTQKRVLNLFVMEKKKEKLVASIRGNNAKEIEEWKLRLLRCMYRILNT